MFGKPLIAGGLHQPSSTLFASFTARRPAPSCSLGVEARRGLARQLLLRQSVRHAPDVGGEGVNLGSLGCRLRFIPPWPE